MAKLARTAAWHVGTACIRYSESTTSAILRRIDEIDRAIPGLCDVLGLAHVGAPHGEWHRSTNQIAFHNPVTRI